VLSWGELPFQPTDKLRFDARFLFGAPLSASNQDSELLGEYEPVLPDLPRDVV